MKQQFEIPGRLPCLNDYLKACNNHFQVGARMKRETQEIVCWAIKAAKLKPMQGKVNETFIWVEPNMRRDKGNIRTGEKFINDALVEMGIIPNDGWKNIGTMSDDFYMNKTDPRIIVILESTDA